MNSSTKRGGKYILTELLEATQSHQVSTKRNLQEGQSPPFLDAGSEAAAGDPDEKKETAKRGVKKQKKLPKKGRPKKIQQLSEEAQLQGPMSLILLDEVRNHVPF